MIPATSDIDRRRFERAYFSSQDDITGIIIVHDRLAPPIAGNISLLSVGGSSSDLGLDGNITNLSIGGLYLVTKKNLATNLEVGGRLTLKEIQATILSKLELNIEMQIRRINNYEFIEHTGLGCEFTGIGAKSLAAIKTLVEWGLHANDSTRNGSPK